MATIVYAVEAWVLALVSWAWLVVMEMWAWSLLGAHVFYGFIWLSTCNLVLTGVYPESAGPRSGYFAAVLVFTLHSACCVLDTVTPGLGTAAFVSPTNSSTCTLARTQQLFFFNGSQLYLAQAGATLGYLVVQLILAGASMLDHERHTLWPGFSWGGGLVMLLCGRLVITFDGLAKGVNSQAKYVQLFTLPLVEYTVIFTALMYAMGVLTGLEGVQFPGIGWRRTVRFVNFGFTVPLVAFVLYVLLPKGMLSPGLLVLVLLGLALGVFGLVEAILTQEEPPAQADPPPAYRQPQARQQEPYPVIQQQWPPAVNPQWRTQPPPGFQPWGGMGKQAVVAPRSRLYIPTPVEMLGEKNKRV
jgi:hypothetical protein